MRSGERQCSKLTETQKQAVPFGSWGTACTWGIDHGGVIIIEIDHDRLGDNRFLGFDLNSSVYKHDE